MTPQTAAALRALIERFRVYSASWTRHQGLHIRPNLERARDWCQAADELEELAAVLTQEGEGWQHPFFKINDAPAEPRAAEGAGTYTPVGNGNIDCCECGESYSAHTDGACPTPTAAAAVPAGGDAVLTFAAFRRANVARCVKWHPEGIASWSPSDWLTAVTGELGELASLLKMRNRERDGLPGNKFSPTDKQVADEIADVLTYLDLLAAVLGVDLGSAAVSKFNEVSERVGFPDRIDLAAPAPRGGVTEAHIDTIRNGSLVFRNAAREYLAAVAHLFDSEAGKDGKFLAEMSPLNDQQCFEAFRNLNDTGARLKQCCDKLDGIVAEHAAADDTELHEDFPRAINMSDVPGLEATPPAAQAQDAGPKARRRVFVDMDGVIVDFDKRKTELGMTGDEIKSLHGAYLDMEPLPGAIEAVRSVIGMGFDVWLATKPPTGVAHAYSDKAAWVFNHLPELKRKLVITHDKGMLGCERDVLIDDRPHKANCEKFRGTLISFTNSKTWADVLAQLRALAAKEAK